MDPGTQLQPCFLSHLSLSRLCTFRVDSYLRLGILSLSCRKEPDEDATRRHKGTTTRDTMTTFLLGTLPTWARKGQAVMENTERPGSEGNLVQIHSLGRQVVYNLFGVEASPTVSCMLPPHVSTSSFLKSTPWACSVLLHALFSKANRVPTANRFKR